MLSLCFQSIICVRSDAYVLYVAEMGVRELLDVLRLLCACM